MSADNKSGYEKGCDYTKLLEKYLDSAMDLPCRNGKPNLSAIARAAKIPRESLYNNPACEELINNAVGARSQASLQDEASLKQERRIASLERTNASLIAEVYELRRLLEQFRHIEAALEKGRRVIL